MSNVPGSPDAPQRRPLGRRAPSVPLAERVGLLEEQLAGIESEVRTRRLVIIDEQDAERVVASASNGASLQLLTADPDDLLELSASDGTDFDPAGPELAVRAWLGGEQIISHVAWRHGLDGGIFDRAQLAHEGDAGTDVIGNVERVRHTTSRPVHADERTEERRRRLVSDAEELLRAAHDIVSRFGELQLELANEAGHADVAAVTVEAMDRSGASRVADVLLVAQELICKRVTASTMDSAQLAEHLEAEGLA